MRTYVITDDVAERILLRHEENNDSWILVSESKIGEHLSEQELREKIAAILVGEPSEILTSNGAYVKDPLYEFDIQNNMEEVDKILALIKENKRCATVLNPEEARKVAETILKEAVK